MLIFTILCCSPIVLLMLLDLLEHISFRYHYRNNRKGMIAEIKKRERIDEYLRKVRHTEDGGMHPGL